MDHQPFGRHRDPAGEAAGHHPPADHALQAAQREQQPAAPDQAAGNASGGQERHEREGEGQPHQPPQHAMAPLPPVDGLEATQSHARVDQLVLRDALVLLEFLGPGLVGQRWNGPGDRLPFGDRQAGIGETRRPPDHHHGEHQRGHGEQPDCDTAREIRTAGHRHGAALGFQCGLSWATAYPGRRAASTRIVAGRAAPDRSISTACASTLATMSLP